MGKKKARVNTLYPCNKQIPIITYYEIKIFGYHYKVSLWRLWTYWRLYVGSFPSLLNSHRSSFAILWNLFLFTLPTGVSWIRACPSSLRSNAWKEQLREVDTFSGSAVIRPLLKIKSLAPFTNYFISIHLHLHLFPGCKDIFMLSQTVLQTFPNWLSLWSTVLYIYTASKILKDNRRNCTLLSQ